MNRLKLTFRSIAYSWDLVFSSSKYLIFLFFGLRLILASFPLLSARLLKATLDALTASDPSPESALAVAILYGASLVLQQGVLSARNAVRGVIDKKARHLYQCRRTEKMASLPMKTVDSGSGKDLIDEVRYIESSAVVLIFNVVETLSALYAFSLAFATLAVFSLPFSLAFAALTVPGVLLGEYFDRQADELRAKKAPDARKYCYYRWMLSDAWPAKDVRMYNLTEPIKGRYEEVKREYVGANKALGKRKLYGMLGITLFCRSGGIVFTAYVIMAAVRGAIGIGDVALYIGFSETVYESSQRIVWTFADSYSRSTELMGKVFAFFELGDERDEVKRELGAFESLVFDNVSFGYPYAEKQVLSGVSFTLNRGDRLSIVGINGSGKSTIVKLMLGLYEVDSGQILINGFPLSDYALSDVRRLFSVLFQSFVQYPLSLRDNVALSCRERIGNDDEVETALQKSGAADDLAAKLKNGLDSVLTRRFDDEGIEPSRGQWQKIALSRAYFKNAPITIFDEPSAALDAEAEDRIFRNFVEIADDKTGVMISHRISSARLSTKIIVLDGGKIVEEGTHEDLVLRGGLYAKLFNLQREKYAERGAKG